MCGEKMPDITANHLIKSFTSWAKILSEQCVTKWLILSYGVQHVALSIANLNTATGTQKMQGTATRRAVRLRWDHQSGHYLRY